MKSDSISGHPRPATEVSDQLSHLPAVPLTLDGSSMLHQMFRIRWGDWKSLAASEQKTIVTEAEEVLTELEQNDQGGTGLFSILGHKGDLMLVHFRHSFEEINDAELKFAQLKLRDYLETTHSYVSVVELGLYEASVQLYQSLIEQGVDPASAKWSAAEEEKLAEHRQAMKPRLWPQMPSHRYVCFYPMDKRRGEVQNWYLVPITERRRMMRDHGLIGRRYAGKVKQVISGSIGFDDWEWGVDLFANDSTVFKKLVYEMRFDEASAMYGLFGPFYLGLRFSASNVGELLDGNRPSYEPN